MKKSLIIVALILLSLSAMAQRISYKDYFDKKHELYIKYPSTWQYRADSGALFIFYLPKKNGEQYRESMNLVMQPAHGYTLNTMLQAAEGQIRSGLKDAKIEKTDTTFINGRSYGRIILEDRSEGIALKSVLYFMITNDRLYTFTASTPSESFHQYYPVFEEMMKSFRFTYK